MKSQPPSKIIWTDRPAPFLTGLASLQSVSESGLDISVYRNDERDLELPMQTIRCLGDFSRHIVRKDENTWSLFDSKGQSVGSYQNVVVQTMADVDHVVEVNRDSVEAEIRDALCNEDLTLLLCAEFHAGASAADQSNFSVLCRRMLQEADTADLQHIFIVDSRRWPCRVMGFVADLGRLSGRMVDTYIDRMQWIQKSWPLYDQHHVDRLSSVLAGSRHAFVTDLIEACCRNVIEPPPTPGLRREGSRGDEKGNS